MLAAHPTQARAQPSRWVRVCLLALLGATLAVRLVVALADYRSLIAQDIYQDDAFYYFKIAQNIVGGRGVTFDGVTATNGFHPLYLALLLPIMAASGGDLIAPIHASAILLTAVALATGLLIFRLTLRLAGPVTALVAVALWAVSPYFTILGINGLETGLATLFAVAVLCAYVEWVELESQLPSRRRAAALGVVFGFAALARIDLLLLVAAVTLDWLVAGARLRQTLRILPRILVTVAATLAVWLPWGVISRTQTGVWLPASGSASREIALHYGWLNLAPVWSTARFAKPGASPFFDLDDVPADYYADVATQLVFDFSLEQPLLAPLRAHLPFSVWPGLDRYPPYLWFRGSPVGGTLLLLLLAGGAILGIRRARRHASSEKRAARGIAGVVGLYLLLMLLGYTFYCPSHWYYSRYLMPAELVTLVFGVSALHGIFLPAWRRRRGARACLTLGILLLVAAQLAIERGSTFSRIQGSEAELGGILRSWRSLENKIDRTRTLGAFQAGTLSYFGQLDVVNLDGKMNPDAARALADGKLHEYIAARQIDYILDWPWILRSLCKRHMRSEDLGFRVIAREPPGGLGFVLWAVERPGSSLGDAPRSRGRAPGFDSPAAHQNHHAASIRKRSRRDAPR